MDVELRDVLDDDPPTLDVVLAGDVSYEERMAERMLILAADGGRRGSLSSSATPAGVGSTTARGAGCACSRSTRSRSVARSKRPTQTVRGVHVGHAGGVAAIQ